MNTSPTLLTAEEAAAIARCSVKTVRRAYATGALVAYRRRGSRAVLLDRRDVLAWVQGETLKPVVPTMAEIDPCAPARLPNVSVDSKARRSRRHVPGAAHVSIFPRQRCASAALPRWSRLHRACHAGTVEEIRRVAV